MGVTVSSRAAKETQHTDKDPLHHLNSSVRTNKHPKTRLVIPSFDRTVDSRACAIAVETRISLVCCISYAPTDAQVVKGCCNDKAW